MRKILYASSLAAILFQSTAAFCCNKWTYVCKRVEEGLCMEWEAICADGPVAEPGSESLESLPLPLFDKIPKSTNAFEVTFGKDNAPKITILN